MSIPDAVQIRHGDTGLPEAGITAGSSATMGVGSAVHTAASELSGKLEALRGSAAPQAGPAALLASAGLDSLEADAVGKEPSHRCRYTPTARCSSRSGWIGAGAGPV